MKKQYIEFCIEHQRITRTDEFFVVGGTKQYLHARFTFCEDWQDENPIVAVFTAGDIAKKIPVENGECEVPWEVLQTGIRKFYVGCYAGSRITSNAAKVDVNPCGVCDAEEALAPTPDVYDQLLAAANEAVDVANSVREDADSGAFKGEKGEKGDKGEAGAIEFVVVNELPAIGDGSKIYLMPETDGEEPNRFGEYVFIEGAWERIGSAGVEVNLDEYVKNTDYANGATAGVVRVMNEYGVQMVSPSTGTIGIRHATEAEIDAKTSAYRSISPKNLDYAVKAGMTTNALEWTADEKVSARELLGAVGDTDFATSTKGGVVIVGEGLTIFSNGKLCVFKAKDTDIDAKVANYRPIVPANLDYAVKKALADCKLADTDHAWTDDEKAAARAVLDSVGETDFATADGTKAGIVKVAAAGANGVTVFADGTLGIQNPSISNLKGRNRYKPLTSAEIENAMWLGITGYKEVWNGKEMAGSYGNQKQLTEEEKGYAQKWLGVSDLIAELTARIVELENQLSGK